MADFVHEGVEMVQNASTEYGRRLKHTRFKKKNVAKKKISCKKSHSQLIHAVPVSLLAPHCLLYLHPQRHSETLSDLGSINSLEATTHL